MRLLLQFRCINKDCPSNYRVMILNENVSNKMSEEGIDISGQTGKCVVCKSMSFAYQVPANMDKGQRISCHIEMEKIVEDMRRAHVLLQQVIGKERPLNP